MKSTSTLVEVSTSRQQNTTPCRRGEHCSSVKIYKKALSLFLSLVMLFSITAGLDFSSYAQTYSGTCGTNVNWSLDTSTGKLTISGSGDMTNYNCSSDVPWCNQCSQIKTVDIKSGVTSIGYRAFYYCSSLTSVTIGNSVTSIGNYAFLGCSSLTNITIPNSVTSIAGWAFNDCSSLTSVIIPNSVTSIGDGAFNWCSSLTSITVNSSNKNYSSQDGILFNKNKTVLIQYPIGNTRTSYTIPNSVTSIGNFAFDDSSLTSVTIGNSVTNIGDYAFSSCDSLTSVTIGNNVTSIGYQAFYSCDSLTSVTIPNGVTSIGDDAFYSCDSLTSVTIGNSVTGIGDGAFYCCSSLTSVTIGNSVTSIGNHAFSGCSSLTNITIPNSVTSIEDVAFCSCSSLTSVTIGNSVTSIGKYAFEYCSSLKDVYYSGSKEQWNKIKIDSSNGCLTNATIHYNFVIESHNNGFIIGVHSNNFVHTNSTYYSNAGFKGIKNYSISSSYKNKLLNGMSNGEKKNFSKKYIVDKWSGSCYGIAATMGLAYIGELPIVNNYNTGAYFDMQYPYQNKEFLDNINYYQLSQYVSRFDKYSKTYFKPSKFLWFEKQSSSSDYKNLEEFFKSLISTIKTDGIVQLSYGYKDVLTTCGHSILAVDYKKNVDGSHTIKLFDENSVNNDAKNIQTNRGNFIDMSISADYTEFSFVDANGDKITQSTYVYLEFYDFDDYKKAEESSLSRTIEKSAKNNYCITVTEKDEFNLTDENGNCFTYHNDIFDSDIDILDVSTIETNGEVQYKFVLDGNANLTYLPLSGSGEIEINNDETYIAIGAENLEKAQIDLDTGIEIIGEQCKYSVDIGDPKDDESFYSITGNQTDTTNISVVDNDVKIKSDDTISNLSIESLNTLEKTTLISNETLSDVSINDNGSVTGDGEIVYCSHTFSKGKITIQPSCTRTGVKLYTCTECGETKTETIPKIAHTYKTTKTKATTKKNGSIVTKCSVCGNVSKKTTIYYPKTITLSTTSYTYNGKVKKPSVTVKDSKGKKISSKYYTVSCSKGRKNVGQYTVTVKFKGNYSGTVKKTFTIKPKATTLSKVTAGKKAFTVKWKKQATQTTGYQIQYSTSSKFKGAKTVTVSNNKTTSKKISKLKAKKKYYVRIRTYKTVKINGKNTKIYSGWSKVKTVKTK